jgi:mediator of RNA polymerase II transcription subunit 5
MGAYTREKPKSDLDALLQMLQRVTRAPSSGPSSGDAQAMHATIMSMVSEPLSDRLKALRKSHPGRKDIESLLSTMKSHSDFRRGPFSSCSELQTWRNNPGSLKQSVRSSIQSLIIWSTSTTISPTQPPPHYNPRQFVIAERAIGAPALLSILIDELKAQTEAPNGSAAVAIDIATSIICAPTTQNSPIDVGWIRAPVPSSTPRHARRLNLRDALRLEFENATDIIKKDQLAAETIVRLHRRVEFQLSLASAPMPDLATSMPAMLPDLGMTADAVTADAVAQAMDFSADPAAGLDLSSVADPMGLDSTMDSMTTLDNMLATQSMQGMNHDDDDAIFGDLDLGMDLDMDGMDMGF